MNDSHVRYQLEQIHNTNVCVLCTLVIKKNIEIFSDHSACFTASILTLVLYNVSLPVSNEPVVCRSKDAGTLVNVVEIF